MPNKKNVFCESAIRNKRKIMLFSSVSTFSVNSYKKYLTTPNLKNIKTLQILASSSLTYRGATGYDIGSLIICYLFNTKYKLFFFLVFMDKYVNITK